METTPDRMPEAGCGTVDAISLANGRLVLPDGEVLGRITVSDGVISEITEGDAVPPGAIDCAGDYVLPGLIELHTDNLERHIEPRPGVDWPHRAALIAHDRELAATGITTVFDAMRVGSISGSQSRYRAYARSLATDLLDARAAGNLKISHYLHLRAEICSDTLLEEMADFGPQDRIGIVSLMDHTPGQRQFRDLEGFKKYVSKKRGFTEEEFVAHVARLREMRAENGERHERGAVAAAKRYGATLASHDDTTEAQVQVSVESGVGFAEFPTTMEAAEACRASGIAVMMGAPNIVRGQSHSGNVSALDLAEAGLLDIISSDYIPAALLLSTFQLAERWGDLPRAVRCVTATPADVTGLTDRGRLETGKRADLIQVRLRDGLPLLQRTVACGRLV